MKVILSRKGYDNQYGGYPSIIFKNKEMISFPIPTDKIEDKGIKSSELKVNKDSLKEIFQQLRHKTIERCHHVDPDITNYFMRQNRFGAFGQAGAAFSHLKNQKVGVGDMFLFFGTFNFIEMTHEHTLRYDRDGYPFHAIWGYLKVDKIFDFSKSEDKRLIEEDKEFVFLKQHPHYINRDNKSYSHGNAIYIGREYGRLYFTDNSRLTKISSRRKSDWELPSFFKGVDISYHKKENFVINKDGIEFRACSRGQEFVFETNKEIEGWIKKLMKNKV